MEKSLQPGWLLYAFAGSFIGIFATLMVPSAGIATFAPTPLTSLRDIAVPEPDPATWADNIRDLLRAAETVTVQQGDTLTDVLAKNGVDRTTAFNVVEAVREVYNLKRLQVGQELRLAYDALAGNGTSTPLTEVNFDVDAAHSVTVSRQGDGTFTAKEILAETHKEFARSSGVIASTLFESAQEQGLPLDVLTSMVKLFSYDVDFQRDIQKGDSFEVMYEHTVTDDGKPVRNLDIRYASMTLSGSPLKFYAFKQDDGSYEFYNDKGEGIRKALLRTPVNGAILTSGFGMRRHPILGYSLVHKGVDFGVPAGTPIMAAGDGVIEKREVNGGYGNYIRVRHASGYSTAYAHMSRFAPDAAVGKRVRQGEVIGYVGSTGRATGPHLHFEVLVNMKQVSPMSVKFPSAQKLEGASLNRFRQAKNDTDNMFTSLGNAKSLSNASDTSPR